MKCIRSSLISLFFTAAVAVPLVACGHPHTGAGFVHFDGGGISLKNGAVLIKLKGQDTAHVSGDGQLRIGDRDIAVSPQARAALSRYDAAALGFTDQAVSLGLDSADFALHTMGQVFSGLLHGSTDQAGKDAEQGSRNIEAKAKALCQRMDEWRLAQDAAAAAAPEFRPYALIKARDTDDCTVSDHDDQTPEKPAPAPQISS
jgi:hypothetical protein